MSARVLIIKVDKSDYNDEHLGRKPGIVYKNFKGEQIARASFKRPSGLHYVTTQKGVGPIYRPVRIDNLNSSAAFSANVRSAPNILSRIGDQWAVTDENVTFRCEVSGNPEPQVTWYKNQKPLKLDRRYSSYWSNNVAQFSILGVEAGDAGWYSCRAENPYGTRETSGMLHISDVKAFRLQSPGKKAITDSRYYRLFYPSMGKIKPF